ncbi:MAG: DEAD/DEAH box helicase family protein [Bradymonadales bacterium]|jgi:superfamily II DNA or RNA helicase
MKAWRLRFDTGSLVVETGDAEQHDMRELVSGLIWDQRIEAFRGEAAMYRPLILKLVRRKLEYIDEAKSYDELELAMHIKRKPFPYQAEALNAWEKAGCRGIVVLPTGAGKTFVAHLAMMGRQRASLIVTPTLDLMHQWFAGLRSAFRCEIGMIGGGVYDPKPISVTTYDSAYIHMDKLGDRYGLLIFDEVHHLPSPSYALAAKHSIAPYRLGLSATPERDDAAYSYDELVGPIVYSKSIKDLAGAHLSEYETIQISVSLSDEEREEYSQARSTYLEFVRQNGIRMNSRSAWGDFLKACARSSEGRLALLAHRSQKRITQCCREKITVLIDILAEHRNDRSIIFTADNDTVYRISKLLLVPAITHQSNAKERRRVLDDFNAGRYPVLVTSRVLNEGVDVPEANVAIVLSGSGSVREHVQRLGRILRAREGKSAVLYEFVAEGTNEEFTSQRRRKHDAYS